MTNNNIIKINYFLLKKLLQENKIYYFKINFNIITSKQIANLLLKLFLYLLISLF